MLFVQANDFVVKFEVGVFLMLTPVHIPFFDTIQIDNFRGDLNYFIGLHKITIGSSVLTTLGTLCLVTVFHQIPRS